MSNANGGGAVGTGFIANLLSGAARLVFVEIQRREGVYQAIQGNVENPANKVIKKAYEGVTQAFGRLGKLDTDLAAFLSALARSEIMKPLAMAAYTGVSWHPLQYAIYSIYLGAVQPEKEAGAFSECEEMTEKIVAGINAHLRYPDVNAQLALFREGLPELQKEATRLVSEAQKRWELKDNSGKLVLKQKAIAKERPWLFFKPGQLDDYVQELSRAVGEEHSKIIVAKPDRQRARLDFADLYVPNKIEMASIVVANGEPFSPIDNAVDFALRFPQTVILGNPGGGKSTLAQGYCLALSEAGRDGGNRLPIFIRIRELFAETRSQPELSILQYIVKALCRVSEHYQYSELIDPIRNLLFNGRCVCIFDGLDEVLSVEDRIRTVTQVERFMSQWPRCSYFVTSRPQGYTEAPLKGFFHTVQLRPFSESESRLYFEKISRAVFEIPEKDLKKLGNRFIAEATRHSSDLIKTPLLLSLIIWLFHGTSRVPDNRLEVYEQCAKLLFLEWDKTRKIDPNLLEPHRLLQFLPILAGEIYPDPDLAGGIERKWLRQRITVFFRKLLGDRDDGRSEEAADQFVSHLAGRAWVLTEKAPGLFEFTQRSFLEYFFAKYLDEQYESVGDLAQTLLPHIKAREWTSPAHIAFQMKAERGINSANRCAETLLSEAISAAPKVKPNVCLFAAEACEYLQPSDIVIEQISHLVVMNAKDEQHWAAAFLSLVQVQTALRGAVYSGVADGLVSLISDYRGRALSPTVDWLVALRVTTSGLTDPVSIPWLDHVPDVFLKISQAIEEKIDFSRITLPFTLKALFDLTGQLSEKHSKYYSHRLWSTSTVNGRRDWRLIDFAMMRNELLNVMKNKSNLDDAPYARLALRLLENSSSNEPEMLETSTIVWAKMHLEEAENIDFGKIDPGFLEALKFVNEGIAQLNSKMPRSRTIEAHNGPRVGTPIFDFISGKTRETITPKEILESYVSQRDL